MAVKKGLALLTALALLLCLAACSGPAPTPSQASAPPAASAGNQAPGAETPWQDTLRLSMALSSLGMPASPDDRVRTWYEVFVASYVDSDGDGMGDLAGLTSMLDYVQWMGFGGLWLMPLHPSPTYHKYDVADYLAIDPQYGTMDDFEALVSACAERGIWLMMDLVLNHTSVQHPWFTAAVEALAAGDTENPYVGYYHFQQGHPGGNWYNATGDWYYEAEFWDGMPDLNLQNPAVRAEFEAIAAFWLDRGVRGFRLDATGEYVSGNATENIEILSWFNGFVKGYSPQAVLVGENWDTTDSLYAYYASGIDSFFNFPFAAADGRIAKTLLQSDQTAARFGQEMQKTHDAIKAHNPNATDAPFFTNHDTARAAGFLRRDEALIKTAWGMNLMMGGNSFVYYGEELGMSGSGRDENKRAPMFWAADATASGMTDGPPEMEPQYAAFPPATDQIMDPASILNYVRHANALRNQYPEIARGDVEILAVADDDSGKLLALRRNWAGSSVILVYNLGPGSATLHLPKAEFGWADIAGSLVADIAQSPAASGDSLTLPAYSITLLQ